MASLDPGTSVSPAPPGATTTVGSGGPMPSAGAGAGQTLLSSNTSATTVRSPKAALEQYKVKDSSKVVVRFKAIGNAPIMKTNHFRITAFNRFSVVIQFLRKELGWKQADALFLYINASFSPAPDDTVGNLYRCFGTEGHLIVNYSSTAAWG
ncbi:Ubiquitin-like protein [Tilletia horrida]|uniref:Ubiquitin-like protein ATG12 n=1 Tax=Tilletia horrida TaxID=155126 RepID=A0AAN6GUH7_9BASI|nr:Ubiquitin-like protein [Tilletia horrida]KAK0554053.1 Ubiquitin-like protein [Tilletia horrida]KAK0568035.1 Ubiquitin-like protein [Tilletia horrida]